MQTIDLFGVKVSAIDQEGILAQVAAWVQEGQCRRVTYVNAHCLNIAISDPAYHTLLNRFDLIYSDGIGVVWAARFLHGVRLYKATGRNWIGGYCDLAEREHLRTYILAGKPGVAQKAKQNIEARWPGINIAGAADGYFVEKSEAQVLSEIAERRPQVLLVGMGVPKQEEWLVRQAGNLDVPVCWAVGALFDYVAGVERPVPQRVDALGLEWLWRMLVNPRGKLQRYLVGNPRFITHVLWHKIKITFIVK